MPELPGEATRLSMLVTLGVAAVGIGAFSLGVTAAARRFPPLTVWLGAAFVVATVFAGGVVRLYLQPLVYQDLDLQYAAFFLGALLGLPSVVAVALAVWRASRPERGTLLLDSMVAASGFVVVLPIALLLASVPEALALFG